MLEDNEIFTLTIDPSSTPDGVSGGQATVTIVDDDSEWFVVNEEEVKSTCYGTIIFLFLAATIQFEQSTSIVSEEDGQVQLVLSLNNPSSTDIVVQVLTSDGLASMF